MCFINIDIHFKAEDAVASYEIALVLLAVTRTRDPPGTSKHCQLQHHQGRDTETDVKNPQWRSKPTSLRAKA